MKGCFGKFSNLLCHICQSTTEATKFKSLVFNDSQILAQKEKNENDVSEEMRQRVTKKCRILMHFACKARTHLVNIILGNIL